MPVIAYIQGDVWTASVETEVVAIQVLTEVIAISIEIWLR
jgi:hypothetical protein